MTAESKRVRAGISLLDAKADGWRKRVDIERLDMGSGSVAGNGLLEQLFPGALFAQALAALGISKPADGYTYGFDIAERYEYEEESVQLEAWARLTETWKEVLKRICA